MRPRCGYKWSTHAGAATEHHTCIRAPGHDQPPNPIPHMCSKGCVPPKERHPA